VFSFEGRAISSATLLDYDTAEQDYYLQYAYWVSSGSYSPHGPRLYPGTVNGFGADFVWIDATVAEPTTVIFYLSSGETNANDQLIYTHSFVDGNVSLMKQNGNSAATGYITVTIEASGYYAFVYRKKSTATRYLVNATMTRSGGSHYGHHPISGLENNLGALGDHRIMSASLMYTNEASPLNKQGKITAVQYGGATSWHTFAQEGFDSVASAIDSATIPIVDGMYGFIKPTGPDNFDLANGVQLNASAEVIHAKYSLDSTDEYVIMYLRCDVAEGRDGWWTVAHHIEYETLDVWRDTGLPSARPEDFRTALLTLSTLPQFSKNSNHLFEFLKRVGASLKRGLSAAAINAPDIIDAINKYGPIAAKAAATIAAVL